MLVRHTEYQEAGIKFTKTVITNLWQLLSNITTNEHSLEVDPQILHSQPILDNVSCVRKLLNPALNVFLKRSIVSGKNIIKYLLSNLESQTTFITPMKTI